MAYAEESLKSVNYNIMFSLVRVTTLKIVGNKGGKLLLSVFVQVLSTLWVSIYFHNFPQTTKTRLMDYREY